MPFRIRFSRAPCPDLKFLYMQQQRGRGQRRVGDGTGIGILNLGDPQGEFGVHI